MNLRPVKLYRVYLELLNSSNVGDFSQGWILKVFIHFEIEKGKFVVVCPRPPYYVALGGFTSQSCSGRRRNVLKSVCCFPHKTNFFFWCCCFLRRLSCLRSLITCGLQFYTEWDIYVLPFLERLIGWFTTQEVPINGTEGRIPWRFITGKLQSPGRS